MFSLSLWGCATITKLARPVAPRHPHACAVVTGQGYSQDPGSYKCGVRRSCSGRGAYGLSPFAPLCGNINKTELPVSLVAGPRQAQERAGDTGYTAGAHVRGTETSVGLLALRKTERQYRNRQ